MTTPETPPVVAGRFAQFQASEQEGEPIGFSIGDEQFACVPVAPGGALGHMIRMAGKTVVVDESIQLIEELISDDDLERFRQTIYRKDAPVRGQTIGDIVNFLIVAYSGRDFVPPAS